MMSQLARQQREVDEARKKASRTARLKALIPPGWQLFTLFEQRESMDATTFLMQLLGVLVATQRVPWLRGWMVLVPAGTDTGVLLARMYPSRSQTEKVQVAA